MQKRYDVADSNTAYYVRGSDSKPRRFPGLFLEGEFGLISLLHHATAPTGRGKVSAVDVVGNHAVGAESPSQRAGREKGVGSNSV